MATGSRLKAIDTQLKTIIAARAGLAAVQVTRGHPGQHLTREAIWTDRIVIEDAEVAHLSPPASKRRQTITADVFVRVSQEGDDAAALRDRCFDLADEVEEALRADPSLGDAAEWGVVTSAEQDDFADSDGRVCVVVLTATYKARKG